VWKRQLSTVGEEFNLVYLSRNLLVHSAKRAMLVNTAGHANFEVEFGSLFGEEGKVISTMFDFEENIYSCFAF
jgi:hypothetical protein